MKKYITKQSDIKGAGKGLFTKAAFKKGEVIGLAHVNDQPYSEIGHNHNHKEENPTAFSKKIDNKRYIFASRDLKPGEEITTNYRLQPELEQPEDFEKKKGGMVSLPKDKPEKSKKFSRSLDATNRLYTENNLFKKPKSRRNKVFDPHAKYYAEGGTYEEAELTPEEIEAYRAEGYTVDDTDYKKGGASEQKIIFSPMEGGCPSGQYWTGTECKIIPKNTKIVYGEEELAKSNLSKKEQQKLYSQYISRTNNHNAFEAARLKKYGTISAKPKYYKTFESIPKSGWDPWMSYGAGTLIENGFDVGIPAIDEPMVPFKQWKKMMDKSSVKPIGFKGHPGGGHFYPVYEKPSNYLLGYNKEEEPIEEEFIPMPIKEPELIDTNTGDIIGQSEQLLAPEYSPSYPKKMIGYDKYNWNSGKQIGMGTKLTLPKRQPNTGGFYKKMSKKVKDLEKYMEGYEDEDGNYIPGEIEKAEQEGRQIKFKGNVSKTDKKAQEAYIQEYDEYENLKNYQNGIMNSMQYKLNKKQFGGLNKFVEEGIILDLSPEEIKEYKKAGFTVEEIY